MASNPAADPSQARRDRVIQSAEDDERAFGDTERLLGPSIDGARYPILAAALTSDDGQALRRELMELFAPQLRVRAPRRPLRIICRLAGQGYDEPVLIKDISASGVRFLVQADVSLDLNRFDVMRLQVRIGRETRALPVALVRRCGGDERHTDLACRFLAPTSGHDQMVAEIRSMIFGEAALAAESLG